MTSPLDPQVLDELGLGGAALAAAGSTEWPASDVDSAKGVGAALALTLATLPAGEPMAPLLLPALERLGISVSSAPAEPRILEFTSDGPLVVRSPRADAGAVLQLPEHPNAVSLDLRASGPFTLTSAGRTVLLVPGEEALEIHEVVEPVALAPLEPFAAPVMDWLQSCSDPWLAQQVRPLAEAGDTWSTSVAAGMLARLLERSGSSRDRVAALLAGQVDPELARPRLWARSLLPRQIETIERLALSEVDLLFADLELAEQVVDESEPGWPEAWVRLCHSRDDLEGIALLLREAGHSSRVDIALDNLDREGRRVHAGLHLQRLPDDERMTRAALRDPFAWWGAAL